MLLFLHKCFPLISFDSGSRGVAWQGGCAATRAGGHGTALPGFASRCQVLLQKAAVHLHDGFVSLPLPGSVPLLPNSLPSRVVLGLFGFQVVPLVPICKNLQQIQGLAEFASLPFILKNK